MRIELTTRVLFIKEKRSEFEQKVLNAIKHSRESGGYITINAQKNTLFDSSTCDDYMPVQININHIVLYTD